MLLFERFLELFLYGSLRVVDGFEAVFCFGDLVAGSQRFFVCLEEVLEVRGEFVARGEGVLDAVVEFREAEEGVEGGCWEGAVAEGAGGWCGGWRDVVGERGEGCVDAVCEVEDDGVVWEWELELVKLCSVRQLFEWKDREDRIYARSCPDTADSSKPAPLPVIASTAPSSHSSPTRERKRDPAS